LNSVPDASHGSSVEDRPESTPNAEARTRDNRERDVVGSSDPSSHHHEARCDGVTEPNAEPGLPP
jgi:hypothetical protein